MSKEIHITIPFVYKKGEIGLNTNKPIDTIDDGVKEVKEEFKRGMIDIDRMLIEGEIKEVKKMVESKKETAKPKKDIILYYTIESDGYNKNVEVYKIKKNKPKSILSFEIPIEHHTLQEIDNRLQVFTKYNNKKYKLLYL